MQTDELEGLLPTEADVVFYEEHGYWVTGKVLPDDVVEAAQRGAERHWSGERDWVLPVDGGFADWSPDDGDGIRNSEYTALQNREIRALVEYPVIGAIAARLTRSSVVRLWDDQLVSKPPTDKQTGAIVGWHTDRAYWMTCTSEAMLTAWIPLQDTPVEMGPVIYIDGSHRWPGTEGLRTFNSRDLDDIEKVYGGTPGRSARRVIPLKQGQMSFHHCRMIHGSDVNRGPGWRTALAVHLQDETNRFRRYLNEEGVPWQITNDNLGRRGPDDVPDYTDPTVFPVLWPIADLEL
jgi:hypothetical protein